MRVNQIKIEVPATSTRWVIGDTHGCINTLKALVKKIKVGPEDVVYLTGDYVDRGPNSKEVIDFLMHHPRMFPLLGNHEKMLLDSIRSTKYESLWIKNGGAPTLASFGVETARDLPKKYINWIRRLPKYAVTGNYVISHAGLNLRHPKPYRDTDTNLLHILWNRDSGGQDPQGEQILVVGHTPKTIGEIITRLKTPKIYIDGGAVFGRVLVALNLETRKIIIQKLMDKIIIY